MQSQYRHRRFAVIFGAITMPGRQPRRMILSSVLAKLKKILNEKNDYYGDYISAAQTIAAARAANLSVCEYVERLWHQVGLTAQIISRMRDAGCFKKCNHICEIGPGTGRYLDLVFRPSARCDIYETQSDWREWLANEYSVNAPIPNGRTLSVTPSSSCDLVMAHGVFVYTPALVTFSYLRESARVLRAGGYLVFDCFIEDELIDIDLWLDSTIQITPLPRSLLERVTCDFTIISEFDTPYASGRSHYFILRRFKSRYITMLFSKPPALHRRSCPQRSDPVNSSISYFERLQT
jgi:hypothetical protein